MMLREVNLPASIRELGKSAFVCIPNNRPYGDLHINMTTIPDNLVKALVYYGSLKTLRCIYVHIDNANGVYDFVLPDSITSIIPNIYTTQNGLKRHFIMRQVPGMNALLHIKHI